MIYGVIGHQLPAKRGSWARGEAAAAGSFGQFLMVPEEGWLIATLNWQGSLLALAIAVLLIAPLACGLREPLAAPAVHAALPQSVSDARREAFGQRSFQRLMAEYFVCGSQVVFIGVHMPSYLKEDHGLAPQVASTALALIGLFNVVGTFVAGALGQRLAKRKILRCHLPGALVGNRCILGWPAHAAGGVPVCGRSHLARAVRLAFTPRGPRHDEVSGRTASVRPLPTPIAVCAG